MLAPLSLAKVFEGLVFKIKLVMQNSFYNQWRKIAPENDSSYLRTDVKDGSNNIPSGVLSLLSWIKSVQPTSSSVVD